MKRTFARQLIIFAREGERLHRWRMILTALSCVVVSLTTYAMILPGLTLEGDYQCGLTEHTHTESCYETGENGDKLLVCTLEEHVHDEHCLAPQKEEQPLWNCGTYEHTHSEDCWQDGVLVCTLEEHTHTDSCKPTVVEQVETKLAATTNLPSIVNTGSGGSFGEGVNVVEIDEKYVDFSIRKNGEPVDLALAHRGDYAFELKIKNPYRLLSYETTKRIYKTRLKGADFTLYAVTSDKKVMPLDEYAGNWVTLKKNDENGKLSSTAMLVCRDEKDYIFYFLSIEGQAENIRVSGSANFNRDITPMLITKSGKWDGEALAYRYTINATIPHVYNAYDQSYYITDTMNLIGTKNVNYNEFIRNKDSISVTLTDGTPIPRIDKITADSSIAWMLDVDGKLWMLNKTKHEGEHLVSQQPTGIPAGWCACWGITNDTKVKITYLDTYAKQYYVKHAGKTFSNNAYLIGDHDNELQATANLQIPDLLSKTFNASSNTFTLKFNAGKHTLPSNYTIHDEMNGATLDANSLTILKKDNNEDAGTPLTKDEYILSTNEKGFELTIKNPGNSIFEVTYRVKRSVWDALSNKAWIDNSGIETSMEVSGRNVKYSESAGNWKFSAILTKVYEGKKNPGTGATFGIYEAATDKLIAKSKTVTEGGKVMRKLEVDSKYIDGCSIEYKVGGETDTILIDSEIGLNLSTVYYIKEENAPSGYIRSTQKYYFYATNPETGKEPDDKDKYGKPLIAINNWETQSSTTNRTIEVAAENGFGESVVNSRAIHMLPSTGGEGTRYLYLAGAVLFLAPLIVLIRRNGESDKKTEKTGKVGKNK